RQLDTSEEGRGRLPRGSLGRVEPHESLHGQWDAASRHLRGEPTERGVAPIHAAAQHHEILGNGPVADLADAALEAERGNVVLATAVRAAADLDVESWRRRHEVRPLAEMIAE